MRKFPCAGWSVGTFPHIEKEETLFFSSKKHIGMVWIVLDNYDFIKRENLETSLNNFSERKDIDFCLLLRSNDVSTLWLLITLCNMPKRLVT